MVDKPGRSWRHNARHAEAHASILEDVKGLAKLLHISKEVADALEVKHYQDGFIQTMVEKEAIASALSEIHSALKGEQKEFRAAKKSEKQSESLQEELVLANASIEALKDRIKVVEAKNRELASENEFLKKSAPASAVQTEDAK